MVLIPGGFLGIGTRNSPRTYWAKRFAGTRTTNKNGAQRGLSWYRQIASLREGRDTSYPPAVCRLQPTAFMKNKELVQSVLRTNRTKSDKK
jgi:hypothetical protein